MSLYRREQEVVVPSKCDSVREDGDKHFVHSEVCYDLVGYGSLDCGGHSIVEGQLLPSRRKFELCYALSRLPHSRNWLVEVMGFMANLCQAPVD